MFYKTVLLTVLISFKKRIMNWTRLNHQQRKHNKVWFGLMLINFFKN